MSLTLGLAPPALSGLTMIGGGSIKARHSGFMGYGDLFSPGSFIINPCFDLWGFITGLVAPYAIKKYRI